MLCPGRTLGPRAYAVYSSFPIGVMKADFFRYAVLLAHGGIYADVDTSCQVRCMGDFLPGRMGAKRMEYLKF